jgi:hypothetical protein
MKTILMTLVLILFAQFQVIADFHFFESESDLINSLWGIHHVFVEITINNAQYERMSGDKTTDVINIEKKIYDEMLVKIIVPYFGKNHINAEPVHGIIERGDDVPWIKYEISIKKEKMGWNIEYVDGNIYQWAKLYRTGYTHLFNTWQSSLKGGFVKDEELVEKLKGMLMDITVELSEVIKFANTSWGPGYDLVDTYYRKGFKDLKSYIQQKIKDEKKDVKP